MRHARPVLGALASLALVFFLSPSAWSQESQPANPDDSTGKSAHSADKDKSGSKDKSDRDGMGMDHGRDGMAMDKGSQSGEKLAQPLRLRAFAVNQNAMRNASNTIDIVIERWSSDAEREQLRDVLAEHGGGDKLLSAIEKIKPRAGYISANGGLGWDIRFAHEAMLPDGGRRIVVGTDRPMSFWEAANRPRSSDYEYMIAEIHLDKNGKGEGRLAPAASVDFDPDTKTIEIENYGTQPVQLTKVEVVK